MQRVKGSGQRRGGEEELEVEEVEEVVVEEDDDVAGHCCQLHQRSISMSTQIGRRIGRSEQGGEWNSVIIKPKHQNRGVGEGRGGSW